MAVSVHPEEAIYKQFLTRGGSVRFELEPSDISSNGDFEQLPTLQQKLTTGFELEPALPMSPQIGALLVAYGGDWYTVEAQIYLRKGKIIYRQLRQGLYEAICTIPIKGDMAN